MLVLVTGGSGFIGSHVVDKLRARGVRVRVFDMVMPTFRNDIEFYHGSLLDLEALRMAMSGVNAVFHLAAIADVNEVYEDPHYSESINVRGTINVLEAARRSKHLGMARRRECVDTAPSIVGQRVKLHSRRSRRGLQTY